MLRCTTGFFNPGTPLQYRVAAIYAAYAVYYTQLCHPKVKVIFIQIHTMPSKHKSQITNKTTHVRGENCLSVLQERYHVEQETMNTHGHCVSLKLS